MTVPPPYHDNDDLEQWPPEEERGENAIDNGGDYGENGNPSRKMTTTNRRRSSSSSSWLCPPSSGSMTRRRRMAIIIVVVLSIAAIALATAVALSTTNGGGSGGNSSSSSSSSGSNIQSTSTSTEEADSVASSSTTETVSNINNDEGDNSNDTTNDNQQEIQAISPSPTTMDISTSPPTTVKPTVAPSFSPPTATPTTASPSGRPTAVDVSNSTDTNNPSQIGNNESDACTPFECIDLGIGRYGHFQWIKRGQALCNDVHRFGLTMSGELVKSSFDATGSTVNSCDDGSESSSSSRVVLHQDPTAEAFQMTDRGHFVLVKDFETNGIGATVVWEAFPNIDIEPSPGLCLSNPPLQCPYLHLRRSSDIVLNSINSIDGSWSDRKVSKLFPDLFP